MHSKRIGWLAVGVTLAAMCASVACIWLLRVQKTPGQTQAGPERGAREKSWTGRQPLNIRAPDDPELPFFHVTVDRARAPDAASEALWERLANAISKRPVPADRLAYYAPVMHTDEGDNIIGWHGSIQNVLRTRRKHGYNVSVVVSPRFDAAILFFPGYTEHYFVHDDGRVQYLASEDPNHLRGTFSKASKFTRL